MVTVGTGLVGVDWEPPLEARCIEAEVSIDLLGRVRAVEDLKQRLIGYYLANLKRTKLDFDGPKWIKKD